MRARGIPTTPISQQGWGLLTHVTLPGGGKLGIYQPRHASPPLHDPRVRTKTRARSVSRKASAAAGKGAKKPRRPPSRQAR